MTILSSEAALELLNEPQGFGKVLNYLVEANQVTTLDAIFAFINERRVACGLEPTTDLNVNSWAGYIWAHSTTVGNMAKNQHTDHELRRTATYCKTRRQTRCVHCGIRCYHCGNQEKHRRTLQVRQHECFNHH